MVVMGPRRAEQPALLIESVQQAGAVSEGEELELEITVAPMQVFMPTALPEMSVTLAFSRDSTRREVFRRIGKNPVSWYNKESRIIIITIS